MSRRADLLPPGPSSPAVWQLLRYSHSPLPYLERCARQFGDQFTLRMAGYPPLVLLSSPESVRDVLRGDPQALHSGEGNEFLKAIVGKNSVLVLDEEPHQRQRRILLPPLKGERMRSFFDAMQLETFEKMKEWSPGQTVTMLGPMQEITLRVMLKVVLGLSSPAELGDFVGKVRRVLELVRGRYGLILVKVLPFERIQKTRWLPFEQRMRELNKVLYALIDEKRRLPPEARGENILADLLAATHQDGQPLSDEEVRDALVTTRHQWRWLGFWSRSFQGLTWWSGSTPSGSGSPAGLLSGRNSCRSSMTSMPPFARACDCGRCFRLSCG